MWSRQLSDDGEYPLSSGRASPAPWRLSGNGRDSDWAFARREAASGMLGLGREGITTMTDDELDVLFDDVQRVRAGRRQGRPESRIFEKLSGFDNGNDTDTESVTSGVAGKEREKYLSNGSTLDNFSLDTAITIPSTPQQQFEEGKLDGASDENDGINEAREEMQEQLDKQKEDFSAQLQTQEAGNVELEELRQEKLRMKASLAEMKADMERQLEEQKREYESKVLEAKRPRSSRTMAKHRRRVSKWDLTESEFFLAKWVLDHWRGQRYVGMAADLLRNARVLKEAQILSQTLSREIVFQFTIIDIGHTFGSSYDLVLNGVSAEETNDLDLDTNQKPCIGVRVVDFTRSTVTLWSMQKLEQRVKTMHQMSNLLSRGPEMQQHFRPENPFEDDCMPDYTRVGDADIPLAAVFECRLQYFTIDL